MSEIPAESLPPVIPANAGGIEASGQPLVEAIAPAALSPENLAAQQRFTIRVWCTFIFVVCTAMFAVGLYLTPSPNGLGSHQQLGLPPCGWLTTLGFPCPTCGCTTAVSNFAHGHILRSFLTQPFGFAVGLLAAALLPLTLMGMVTGSWLGPSMFWLGWHWKTWVILTLVILLGGWAYKIIIYQHHITF